MRFCPFCAQENADESSECAHCGRRLPQLAARAPVAPPSGKLLRPPPVRPLPRSRVVAPAPALPQGRGGAVAGNAAPAGPEKRPEKSPEKRPEKSTTSDPALDSSTRIEPSPFDRPGRPTIEPPLTDGLTSDGLTNDGMTRETPRHDPSQLEDHTAPSDRFEKDASEPKTTVRLGEVRAAQSDEDPTYVRDEKTSPSDDRPTDVHTQLPGERPRALPIAKPLTRLGREAHAAPPPLRGAPMPPPMPLPPPPAGAAGHFRADPIHLGTNPRAVLPKDERAPRPGPELPLPATDDTSDGLGPMPPVPPAGLLPAVKYLVPLARAIWERHKAQAALRALLHGDQRLVDDTLHDLGRVAWQEPSRPAELRAELDRADEDDARRREQENEVARIDMSLSAERERFSTDEHERKEAIAAREAEIARVQEDLAERRRAQRTEEKTLRQVDARFIAAEKQVTQLVAKAARAEVTPAEKGGGANAAANLRSQAEAAQREADGFRPERDAAMERVRSLDQPIAELSARLDDERAKLGEQQTALTVARRDHKAAISSLDAQRTEHDAARANAERALRLRMVSTGTLLSLHRMDSPKLAPVYARLDELQATAAAREARISKLEAERNSYDRPSLQRGLVVVGAAAGVFVILLVIVLVLLAR